MAKIDWMTVREKIDAIRISRAMSKTAVVAASGIGANTALNSLSNAGSDRRDQSISVSTLIGLAAALNCSTDDFFPDVLPASKQNAQSRLAAELRKRISKRHRGRSLVAPFAADFGISEGTARKYLYGERPVPPQILAAYFPDYSGTRQGGARPGYRLAPVMTDKRREWLQQLSNGPAYRARSPVAQHCAKLGWTTRAHRMLDTGDVLGSDAALERCGGDADELRARSIIVGELLTSAGREALAQHPD